MTDFCFYFSVVGSPRQLFMECIGSHDLDTAASYLLILQNLEPPAVAQNHATILLDAALDRCSWDLAKELVRFLRTIDPDEVEEASQRPLASINPTSAPINPSAPEEEISLLLGKKHLTFDVVENELEILAFLKFTLI